MIRVSAPGRLHFGFGNLSLSHSRLYGAIGIAIDGPKTIVTASQAEMVRCDNEIIRQYATQVCEDFSLPGVELTLDAQLPRHTGLGSGTQLALAVLVATLQTYEQAVDVRSYAPTLGRGGRSGVGVAAFENGGFVLDGGHPTTRFTTDRPADGEWTVPPVIAQHQIPDSWRFVLVFPDVPGGRNGGEEDESMRAVIERADPQLADRISGLIVRQILPAVAGGRVEEFGNAIAELGRLNGAWYADEQGGVYRPPVGSIVESLSSKPSIYGAGQSSWGPSVYGVTDQGQVAAAKKAGQRALADAGVAGDVLVVSGRNSGATIETL